MKKNCRGCKALEKTGYDYFCTLKYKIDTIKGKPLENCSKPLTINSFYELFLKK
jgi:hypothetical protein